MQGENGSMTPIWASGLSWKLENEDLKEICYSKCFFIQEKERLFYFELLPKTEDTVCLSLWQIRGSKLKTLNLLIQLWYKDVPKHFIYRSNSIKNICRQSKIENAYGLYDIKTIKAIDLSEIRMHVLIAETFYITDDESESNDEYYEADSDDELCEDDNYKLVQETNDNKKGKYSERESNKEEIVKEEENKTVRRGEIALIENLKNIFLDEEDSDVILKVGDQKYPAHKVIIRTRSPVFYAMLKHDMKEKQEGAIDIEDCDPHVFREFLQNLYSGKLDTITGTNVYELYHMSDKYDMKELRMDCVDFIRNNLNVRTICDTISLATKHCEIDLLTQATTFFIDNVQDIITTVNWQNFLKKNPIEANELFIKTVKKNSCS